MSAGPVEPTGANVARDAVDEHVRERKEARSRTARIVVRIALVISIFLVVGPCTFIVTRARARTEDHKLWVSVISTRAELDCCAGDRGPCHEAEEALVTLSARLHTRESSLATKLSELVGSAIGTNDLELGSELDVANVDKTLEECRARVEVEKLRAQVRERADVRQ